MMVYRGLGQRLIRSLIIFFVLIPGMIFADKLASGWKMLVLKSADCVVCNRWKAEVDQVWHEEGFDRFMDVEQKLVFDIENSQDEQKLAEVLSRADGLEPVLMVPSVLFLDPGGQEVYSMRIEGYHDVATFKRVLEERVIQSNR